jgi:ubiquinone biosynthesis protein UbiJ
MSGLLTRATKSLVRSTVQHPRAMATRLTDMKRAIFEQLAINSKAIWKERVLI